MFKKFILGLIVFIGATSMAFGVVDSQIERFNFETIPYEIIDGTLPFDSFLSVNNLVNAIERVIVYIFIKFQKKKWYLIFLKD